jgi:hypothetical protein
MKTKPNSSYAGAGVLLGISAETIDICMPMLKYIDGLSEKDKQFWRQESERVKKQNDANSEKTD